MAQRRGEACSHTFSMNWLGVSGFGFRVSDFGFRFGVQGLGCRVFHAYGDLLLMGFSDFKGQGRGLKLMVQGAGCRVQGIFRLKSLSCRV